MLCCTIPLPTCFRVPACQAGGIQESLKPAAAVSLVVYTLGLPLSFLVILVKHRRAIQADQALRVANKGNDETTNPNFYIRRRYQELYRCVLVCV